jgi:hypothetical protein
MKRYSLKNKKKNSNYPRKASNRPTMSTVGISIQIRICSTYHSGIGLHTFLQTENKQG